MFKKQILLYLSILVLPVIASAQIGGPIVERQPQVYKTTQSTIYNTPETSISTRELAFRITRGSKSDLEKARAIFKWIGTNISYDHELKYSSKMQKEFYISEEKVIAMALQRKKALCGGYAFLFEDLCTQVGIKSEVIHGFSKANSYRSRRNKNPEHSWNAVLIDNNWYLLDLTLAVSHAVNNKPDMYWFQTDPVYFTKNHFPLVRKWALLQNTL